MNKGLKEPKKDIRDFSRHAKFGSVDLAILPKEGLKRPKVKSENQGNTQLCTAYTLAGMRRIKFNKEFSPDWIQQKEAEIEGTTRITGHSLRTQAKVACNFGVLPKELSPFSWQDKGEEFISNPDNWDKSLDLKAEPYKAGGFFSVVKDSPYDTYDSIRVSLAMHDVDKEGITVGIKWFGEFNSTPDEGILPTPNEKGFSCGHNIQVYDWNEKGLLADAHEGKIIIIPREIANKYIYTSEGPYIILDGIELSRVKAEQWGILELLKDALIKLTQWIKDYFKEPMIDKSNEISIILPQKAPMNDNPIETQQAEKEKFDAMWGTPEKTRHSCRVIMDEYNLSWKEKDLLCACIQQESNFNYNAISKINSNGTQDFGLCQFNNGKNKQGIPYWIGKGADFENPTEVLSNPEKNVRIMIREYKKGNLKLWASYSSGAYKKYL